MVGEDLVELVLVFRLEEGVNGPGGELGKCFIGGGEDGEGAGAFERVNQATGFDGGDEGGVVGGVEGVFNDVPGGEHFGSSNHGVLHLGVRECGRAGNGEEKCEGCVLEAIHWGKSSG